MSSCLNAKISKPFQFRPSCRQTLRAVAPQHNRNFRASAHQRADYSFTKIRDDLLRRRPKLIYDYLSPMPSHLLSTALSDHIPISHQPASYQDNPTPINHHGTPLPQGHHLVYFPFQLPSSRLAPDGADLDHAPGEPFVRRMWAGGSIRFRDDSLGSMTLQGGPAVCLETIENVTLKDKDIIGKEKVFVDTWRRYLAAPYATGASVDDVKKHAQIEERRTLVFMRHNQSRPPGERKPAFTSKAKRTRRDSDISFSLVPDPFLLFNFSALCYNAHFIHFERQWTQVHEGYRDLLVHGPLSLTLLFTALRPLLTAQDEPGDGGRRAQVRSLEYRNLAPLYCGEKITVSASASGKLGVGGEDGKRKWDVWVEGPDGGLAVKGKAESVLVEPLG